MKSKMKDRVCLITGATSGIGKEIAIALAKHGSTIIFTGRDRQKNEMVRNEIITLSNNKKVEFIICDLSSFNSIKEFYEIFRKKYDRLDVLINCAGTAEFKRKLSKDGIENTFAVNHLAPFLLTNLLTDIIKNSAPARIINVSADLHKYGAIDFNDLEKKSSYSILKAYSQSKLANILFTKQLAHLLKDTGVTANCLLPGQAITNLIKDGNPVFHLLLRFFKSLNLKRLSAEMAAQTPVYLATSPDVENITGECFKKNKIIQTSRESCNMDKAKRLWEVSREYVKEFLY
ncbi:MAG: SDR family oxidoreductase [Bacteroidetes bacterium]|nr:MAG: SDR family oxidoreductase [Bacteroidota bacterium]